MITIGLFMMLGGFIIAVLGALAESNKLTWLGLGIAFVGAYFAMFK